MTSILSHMTEDPSAAQQCCLLKKQAGVESQRQQADSQSGHRNTDKVFRGRRSDQVRSRPGKVQNPKNTALEWTQQAQCLGPESLWSCSFCSLLRCSPGILCEFKTCVCRVLKYRAFFDHFNVMSSVMIQLHKKKKNQTTDQ